MTTLYFILVIFLLVLAVFDLFVGVSNDAVNFLNSAIGAKTAKFRTVLVIASAGVLAGALMSAGMMDVARHGIMHPVNYSFQEVMMIFLAVMVTDIIILDIFNSLGLPTSTTVSLVFELLGGTFIIALFKMHADPSLTLSMLLNSDKALSVIIAIFVSVAIAFVFGVAVQWITRLVFTFDYRSHRGYGIAVFGGVSFTFLAYFIFIKGLAGSPYIAESAKTWITANTPRLLLVTLAASTVVSWLLDLLRIDVFKIIVLTGTFALAMAFAGNDLVNFIGVPLAGLSSYEDWMAHGAPDAQGYMMVSLMQSAQSPFLYLLAAGIIMVVAMATSKKAQNVVKTSVDLSRQDEGDEMFGSSKAARSIVQVTRETKNRLDDMLPYRLKRWIDGRFHKEDALLEDGAAFDEVRAAVNLVLASILIIFGTTCKLPLSTTYVTFMVAMGSSLADRAWGRESAVFRVTGVLSVIGGWFMTAGVAFAACALVSSIIWFAGYPAMIFFMGLVVFLLVRSNRKYNERMKEEKKDDTFLLMMRSKDPGIVWELLGKHVQRTQSYVCRFVREQFDAILDGLNEERPKELRKVQHDLGEERDILKKLRRKEFLCLRRAPKDIAVERNTWFHLGANSDQQFIYCLKRMLEPVKEHVDNNFNPIPKNYVREFLPVRNQVRELMKTAEEMIATNRYGEYRETLQAAEDCKEELSRLRKRHIDRMQNEQHESGYKISLVYLNLLQETQELLSILRHQIRAARKFLAKD